MEGPQVGLRKKKKRATALDNDDRTLLHGDDCQHAFTTTSFTIKKKRILKAMADMYVCTLG